MSFERITTSVSAAVAGLALAVSGVAVEAIAAELTPRSVSAMTSVTKTIKVTKAKAFKVTAKVNKTKATVGKTFTIKGKVTPMVATKTNGKVKGTVKLKRAKVSKGGKTGKWVTIRKARLTRTARYTFTITASTVGIYKFRVTKASSRTRKAGRSKVRTVRVAKANQSADVAATPSTPAPPADTTPPPVPTGLVPTAGDGRVELFWNSVSGDCCTNR